MTLIPQEVFDTYKVYADALINELGVNCKLLYPPRIVQAPNTQLNMIGGKSNNRFSTGGPMSSNLPGSEFTGGTGVQQEELSEIIKLRVYNDASNSRIFRDFIQRANVQVADGSILIIGFIYDFPKIQRANKIIVNSDLQNYTTWEYEKATQPLPWGLKLDRYFACILKRA